MLQSESVIVRKYESNLALATSLPQKASLINKASNSETLELFIDYHRALEITSVGRFAGCHIDAAALGYGNYSDSPVRLTFFPPSG